MAETEKSVDDLTDEQLEKLLGNSDVKRMLEYEETPIPDVVEGLRELLEEGEYFDEDSEGPDYENPESTYEMFLTGIADHAGRTKANTIHKIFKETVREYERVS